MRTEKNSLGGTSFIIHLYYFYFSSWLFLIPEGEIVIKHEKVSTSKICFQRVEESELDKILDKNKNLFQIKEVKAKPLPLIGTANCNM